MFISAVQVTMYAVPFFFLVCSTGRVHAFPWFRDSIPNGNSVPNPNSQGGIWAGVGHVNAGGGGARNPFGEDFENNEYQWTTELCQQDSDGDGRSNGVELGDPDCVWVEGEEPALPAQSHPGIVDEPVPEDSFDPCDTFDPPADTTTLDIAFSAVNNLPATPRTQYVCEQQTVSAPYAQSRYYHLIRSDIFNNNPTALHHIWIYECDGVDSSDGNKVDQGSYGCSGIEGNCVIVAGWALGAQPYCEPDNVGVLVDFGSPGGSKVFKVEAHYDNALVQPQQDQSGMRLYLTPSLRPLDSGLVIVGMDYYDRQFEIPAGQSSYSLTNICPTTATQQLPHPIWIYSWNPHMHYYGKQLVTEHYRCGKKIGEIGRIDAFEFDNQQSYYFEEPIKFLPGDALFTTCTYDTTDVVGGPVLGGEETTNEMCDNYVTFYPFAGTQANPTFFTACNSFAQGLNPVWYNGIDDTTPFVTLDLSGDTYLENYDPDPANNMAPCCDADDDGLTCLNQFLSDLDGACAIDSDCRGSLQCDKGLCIEGTGTPPSSANVPSATPTSGAVNPGFCFSAIDMVVVENKGDTKLQDLHIGDKVLVQDGKFETVYGFGHLDRTLEADFLRLESSSSALELTDAHLVFVEGRHNPVAASDVRLGDSLITSGSSSAVVEKIGSVPRVGVYAPYTPSGTIVVNGFLASTFTAFKDSDLVKEGGIVMPLSEQFVAHRFEALHRLVCFHISMELCKHETYDGATGLSSWVHGPLKATQWVMQQNILVSSVLLAVVTLALVLLWAVETILDCGDWRLLVGVLVLSLVVLKRVPCGQANPKNA